MKGLKNMPRSGEIWPEVQPPFSDKELVDMFMGTITRPFFNHLIGNSSFGFTELILTGEHVESGIKSGKIQVAASSSVVYPASISLLTGTPLDP